MYNFTHNVLLFFARFQVMCKHLDEGWYLTTCYYHIQAGKSNIVGRHMTQTQQAAVILTLLVIAEICFHNLVVKPQVRDDHSVLRQSAGLVWTNHRCRAHRLNWLQIFYQAVFVCHSLCSNCQWNLYKANQSQNFNTKLQVNDGRQCQSRI